MWAVGSSNTPCLLLGIKMKCSVVLFRHKSVWIGGGYGLFSSAKSGIGLWVLLLLNIVLASLRTMVRNLSYLIFKSSLLNYLFILRRLGRSKPINLSLPNIASRILNFVSSNQVLLTRLFPFLHRAFNFTALSWWYCPLLVLWACIKVLSGKLLLIHVGRHGWLSFHIVPLFHKLSHNFSCIILDRITVLLVKNWKNMY